MVKRSSRIAKRDEFENTLSSMEKSLAASLAKKKRNPAAVQPGSLDEQKSDGQVPMPVLPNPVLPNKEEP
jgi:hypothetical protein